MIAGFSPFTQRLLALGILFFLGLGLLNLIILPLYAAIGNELALLADTRFRLAHLEQIQARPNPPELQSVPTSFFIVAPSEQAAATQLQTQLNAFGARFQVKVTAKPVQPSPGSQRSLVEVSLTVQGGEGQVLSLLNGLEQGQPMIRLKTWRLYRGGSATPTDAGSPALPISPDPLIPTAIIASKGGLGTLTSVAGAIPPTASNSGSASGRGSATTVGQPVSLEAVAVAAWTSQP